jgi:hypothetical protein
MKFIRGGIGDYVNMDSVHRVRLLKTPEGGQSQVELTFQDGKSRSLPAVMLSGRLRRYRHVSLILHPPKSLVKAKRVHARQCENDDKQTKTVTVLEIPPVDSPQTAVKVAIAAKARG